MPLRDFIFPVKDGNDFGERSKALGLSSLVVLVCVKSVGSNLVCNWCRNMTDGSFGEGNGKRGDFIGVALISTEYALVDILIRTTPAHNDHAR